MRERLLARGCTPLSRCAHQDRPPTIVGVSVQRRDLLSWFLGGMYLVLTALSLPGLGPRMVQDQRIVGWTTGTATLAPRPLFEPWPGHTHLDYRGNALTMTLPALSVLVLIPVIRRKPLAAAICLGLAIAGLGPLQTDNSARYSLFIAATFALFGIARRQPRRLSLSCAAIVFVPAAAVFIAYPSGDSRLTPQHIAVLILLTAVAWLLGNSSRERRAHAARLAEEHASQAVTTERLRIARELHDMIAHSVGIIAIQAGMGNRVIQTQPAEARKALQAIEETSRDTLSQLRRTLIALRQSDDSATPLDVMPGLGDLDKLVASTRHAGMLVIVETRGLARPLPAEVDLAAYRIVQESVTNVVRHAGVRSCRVVIEYRDEDLAISVADDGHGVLGTGGAGFGLVGMRERVSLLHGDFSAGPRLEGGFRVAARLPVPAEAGV